MVCYFFFSAVAVFALISLLCLGRCQSNITFRAQTWELTGLQDVTCAVQSPFSLSVCSLLSFLLALFLSIPLQPVFHYPPNPSFLISCHSLPSFPSSPCIILSSLSLPLSILPSFVLSLSPSLSLHHPFLISIPISLCPKPPTPYPYPLLSLSISLSL